MSADTGRGRSVYPAVLCAALLILSLFFAGNPRAQDVPWPIEADRYITSSFGEHRPGRFHYGVDFSSSRVTGKPVIAIGDGYIARVSTSPFGYGKLLEFALDDGGKAIYAHLSAFSPAIEDSLVLLRERRHSYQVELVLEPGRFRARKGEIICWSGDTGSGPPHLHLELRDGNGNPLNPLEHGLAVSDTVRPEIGDIALIPLDRDSFVNGSTLPVRYDPSAGEPLYLSGRTGVAAALIDRANSSGYALGVYRAFLEVDSILVFSKQYSRITHEQNHIGAMDYLTGSRNGCSGTLSALFRREGNPLDFYRGDGILSIPPYAKREPHTLRITAADYAGNAATASVPVIFGARPILTECFFASGGVLHVAGADSSGDLAGVEVHRSTRGAWVLHRCIEVRGRSCKVSLPFGETAVTCRVTLVSRDGARSIPSVLSFTPLSSPPPARPVMDMRVTLLHDRAAVTLTSTERTASLPRPAFTLNGGPDTPAIFSPTGETAWTACIPLADTGRSGLRIVAGALDSSLGEMLAAAEVNANRIGPADETTVSSPDGICSLGIGRGALYRAAPVEVDTAAVQPPERLAPVSGVYRITWGDEPVKGPCRVTFHLENEPSAHSCVFFSGKGDSWRFLGKQQRGRLFSAACNGSGFVAVFQDSLAPILEVLEPPPESVTGSSRPELRVRVEDEESGIGRADAVNLFIDGRAVYGEYDPERGQIRYRVRENLSPGVHHAAAAAIDRAGNRSVQSWNFTVR